MKGFQLLADGFIQLCQGQKPAAAQSSQNPGGNYAHRTLCKGFVLGSAGTGWKNGSSIVLCHLLVGLVEYRFGSGVFNHAGL